jgi:Uma2 family endonuclease
MSATAAPATARYLIPPIPVRRFTVDEYHRMIQAGILTEYDKVELLDGWITPKMTRNPPHDYHLTQAQEALRSRLPPPGWVVRSQCAITLPASEPEPDVAVVPGPVSRYRTHHPGPADVTLVIEVADSTLDHDRDIKGAIYAQANLVEYWIVNLVDRIIEVYTIPSATGYLQRQDYALPDVIPLRVAGQVVGQVPVVELLG